jgi:hypothetical protein
MPSHPSVRDAMLAIASLGGRMHHLLLLELGWRARQQAEM